MPELLQGVRGPGLAASAMAFAGGFEEEELRQSCLRGRRFTSSERESQQLQFHQTSVFLSGDMTPTNSRAHSQRRAYESKVDRPMSKSLSGAIVGAGTRRRPPRRAPARAPDAAAAIGRP